MAGLLIVGLAASAGPTVAQELLLGAQGSWAADEGLGVGGRLHVSAARLLGAAADTPLGALTLAVTGDYFLEPDCGLADCTYLEVGGNILYPFRRRGATPYVGAGAHWAQATAEYGGLRETSTGVGANLLAGGSVPVGPISLLAEGRYELGGGEQLVVTVGALLLLR